MVCIHIQCSSIINLITAYFILKDCENREKKFSLLGPPDVIALMERIIPLLFRVNIQVPTNEGVDISLLYAPTSWQKHTVEYAQSNGISRIISYGDGPSVRIGPDYFLPLRYRILNLFKRIPDLLPVERREIFIFDHKQLVVGAQISEDIFDYKRCLFEAFWMIRSISNNIPGGYCNGQDVKRHLVILATCNFSESRQLPAWVELFLYRASLSKWVGDADILIKTHPRSSDRKNRSLFQSLEKAFGRGRVSFDTSSVPLEVLTLSGPQDGGAKTILAFSSVAISLKLLDADVRVSIPLSYLFTCLISFSALLKLVHLIELRMIVKRINV